jgi:uncharacterized membrane protein YdfJ with MMPL/SSD domain
LALLLLTVGATAQAFLHQLVVVLVALAVAVWMVKTLTLLPVVLQLLDKETLAVRAQMLRVPM